MNEETQAGGQPPTAGVRTLSDPERWVDEYGDYLFKYALTRLRDPSRAEDMVQETFLAALKGGAAFAGQSSPKSWLVGILKNKICDHFRKASRETSFTDLESGTTDDERFFAAEGAFANAWKPDSRPGEWPEPGAGLDNEAFWKAFRDCSDKLPRNVGIVFNLRELDEVDSKEICAMLNISESNLWVMLHRARLALRRCLEINWFGKQTAQART